MLMAEWLKSDGTQRKNRLMNWVLNQLAKILLLKGDFDTHRPRVDGAHLVLLLVVIRLFASAPSVATRTANASALDERRERLFQRITFFLGSRLSRAPASLIDDVVVLDSATFVL